VLIIVVPREQVVIQLSYPLLRGVYCIPHHDQGASSLQHAVAFSQSVFVGHPVEGLRHHYAVDAVVRGWDVASTAFHYGGDVLWE